MVVMLGWVLVQNLYIYLKIYSKIMNIIVVFKINILMVMSKFVVVGDGQFYLLMRGHLTRKVSECNLLLEEKSTMIQDDWLPSTGRTHTK